MMAYNKIAHQQQKYIGSAELNVLCNEEIMMKKKTDTASSTDYSAYVGMGHNQPTDIPEINRLAELQHKIQLRTSKLESDLKSEQEELRNVAEKLLPEAMENLGLSTYTTTTGISVQVKEKIRGALPVENRPKGFDWLEKNGFGGLIESEVVIPFKRDELEEANKLVEELRDKGKIAVLERNVHHARLDSFIREQLAQGAELPLDIFGVFRQRIAKVEV